MSDSITLNYKLAGLKRIDTVTLSKGSPVETLKKKIRDAHKGHLDSDFDLWKIFTTIHLDELEKVEYYPLADDDCICTGVVSVYFPDPPAENQIHLVARPRFVFINCYIEDAKITCPISVKLQDFALSVQKGILNVLPYDFQDLRPPSIRLWKVLIPVHDSLDDVVENVSLTKEIPSAQALSEVFTHSHELARNHIHVYAKINKFPVRFIPPSHTLSGMMQSRAEIVANFPKLSPSKMAQKSNFSREQNKPVPTFYYGRPSTANATVPLMLYERIFAQFQEDCESYIPTEEDHQFALNFSEAMSAFFDNEDERAKKAREILLHYGLQFEAGEIGRFRCDGYMRLGNYHYAILEYKVELGSGGAEPLHQAMCYYMEATKELVIDIPSRLPCIILYALGAHIGFAGAIWTDKPHVEVLSPIIALSHNINNAFLRLSNARCFGAMKKAILSLRDYYSSEGPPLFPDRFSSVWPYPKSYKPRSDGETSPKAFNYCSAIKGDKLVFQGRTADDLQVICIKFARNYSTDAHDECFSIGFAPELYGFESLVGGWKMIVMEYLGDDYQLLNESPQKETFRSEIEEKVRMFHRAGYVHGDIRADNIMVKKHGKDRVKLLDFDWSNKIGEAYHPRKFGKAEIPLPQSAGTGGLMQIEDDIRMIDSMFA